MIVGADIGLSKNIVIGVKRQARGKAKMSRSLSPLDTLAEATQHLILFWAYCPKSVTLLLHNSEPVRFGYPYSIVESDGGIYTTFNITHERGRNPAAGPARVRRC